MIHLDTHVLVWVLAGNTGRLPPGVRALLESEQLMISPTVHLELTYLHEIGRVTATAQEVLQALRPALDLVESTTPFSEVVVQAAALTWTRDPFDRLIVGNALADGAGLLSADGTILTHCPSAHWPTG